MQRLRAILARRGRRLRDSALPVLQCALAAGLAYLVARDLLGHAQPFFAPIACVLVLGLSLTNRLRRSVELAVGVSLGVAVGDLIVVVIGSGWWQISVVVGLTLVAALLFDVGVLLLNQAAVSAVLVATLQPPGSEAAFSRWIDTLVGAAVGLAMAALLPSQPLTGARRGLASIRAGEPPPDILGARGRRRGGDGAVLRAELTTGDPTDGARCAILDTAATVPSEGGGYSADVVLAQVRSMLVDLLGATGMGRDDAVSATSRARPAGA